MSDLVAITGIAAGGDGVGRLPEGRAVFVSRTAPGDRVRVRDVKLRKNFAHATLHEVVTPSGARVTAPCGHYQQDHCGGCQCTLRAASIICCRTPSDEMNHSSTSRYTSSVPHRQHTG